MQSEAVGAGVGGFEVLCFGPVCSQSRLQLGYGEQQGQNLCAAWCCPSCPGL